MSKSLNINIDGKSFPIASSRLAVLGSCEFHLRAGEFGVLLGPSGCGKTTLLRMVLGLERDFEGTIQCGGQPIVGPSSDRGIVFQEPRLMPWKTALANVEFGISRSALSSRDGRKRAREMLELVGLGGFERRWPRELSGGMAQRVALARALVNVPSVLLLDEPFGALDTGTRATMQDELRRIILAAGTTTLLVTHDVEEALYLADKIVVFSARPGRVVEVHELSVSHPRIRGDERLSELRESLLKNLFAVPANPVAE